MFHTYVVPPIDMGWEFLRTVTQTARELGADDAAWASSGHKGSTWLPAGDFQRAWENAQAAARNAGWEGDFRNEPVVFWLPNDTEFHFGFVFKQDNNGTTFVVSPVLLQHLAEFAV